jgi:hypothetical protein
MVGLCVAEGQEAFGALRDDYFLALDAREWIERRTGGSPAFRAVAIERVNEGEGVANGVVRRTAQALPAQQRSGLGGWACRHRHALKGFAIDPRYTSGVTWRHKVTGFGILCPRLSHRDARRGFL